MLSLYIVDETGANKDRMMLNIRNDLGVSETEEATSVSPCTGQ